LILLNRLASVKLPSCPIAHSGATHKVLDQAVKRNAERFPLDFMFQLTLDEFAKMSRSCGPLSGSAACWGRILRSQIVTSSWGGRRYPPYAFTEHGVAMLSSVLNSGQAIQVEDLARKLAEIEKRYDAQFRAVFDAIRQLMAPPEKPRRSIGFRVEEAGPRYRVRRVRRRA